MDNKSKTHRAFAGVEDLHFRGDTVERDVVPVHEVWNRENTSQTLSKPYVIVLVR